jgi:hypothetical protein
MQKNSDNLSMEEALRLAKSPAGQQLLALLQQSNPDAISQAMQQASRGDYSKVKETLTPLLTSQDVQSLLRQLGGR